MSSITGLQSMGTVIQEYSTKDAGLFTNAMPMQDSSSQLILDIFGATRTINIKGVYTIGDSPAYPTIASFIADLDNLVNGSQTMKTYVSDKSGASYTGLVSSVYWNADSGNPNQVDYTITFIQGVTT